MIDRTKEVFVSLDVEADGPIPGPHSMLSLGAAAFQLPSEDSVGSFQGTLDLLPGSTMHPSTKHFWDRHPKEYAATRMNLSNPVFVMTKFAIWIESLGKQVTAVCYPLGFDWSFINWYFHRFVGYNPFGLSGVDIKTLAWAHQQNLGVTRNFRDTTKRTMPREWFGDRVHNHLALDDAIEQGVTFVRIQKTLSSIREKENSPVNPVEGVEV